MLERIDPHLIYYQIEDAKLNGLRDSCVLSVFFDDRIMRYCLDDLSTDDARDYFGPDVEFQTIGMSGTYGKYATVTHTWESILDAEFFSVPPEELKLVVRIISARESTQEEIDDYIRHDRRRYMMNVGPQVTRLIENGRVEGDQYQIDKW